MDKIYIDRFNAKHEPEPNSGCWLWTASVDTGGYGHMGVNRRLVLAHRLSWMIHKNKSPAGFVVMHKCDIPCCVNPDHLMLGTQSENVADRDKKKRRVALKGEACGASKLTRSAIDDIRQQIISQREYAKRHGVSQAQVQRIQSGKSWVNV
jgi:hypothetical protein